MLTRLVLDHKSSCTKLPLSSDTDAVHEVSNGCWHPKKFDKTVIVIIDALRYDFTIPYKAEGAITETHYYHNSIPVLYETATQHPSNAFLRPFIADPPTTTLQRLKGLTTGTLPTFMDAGSNFAGTAIEEDNLIDQWKDNGKRLVHLGDDTWHALFPNHFEPALTHSYDSFNVWDLHTVDEGVIEHIFPSLHAGNSSKWDILIGHCLGVDHAGHRYGPDHSAMQAKLQQMDNFIRKLIDSIDEETLLVVMGDHGMDSKGDHGGESDDEVEAALWMYSKKPVFGRTQREFVEPPSSAKIRPVSQIDLVPTLALLMGAPIPFNNLGIPIEEAFIGSGGKDWQNLATVSRLASAQIKRYQKEYNAAKSQDESDEIRSLWAKAEEQWSNSGTSLLSSSGFQESYDAYREYQIATLRRCRALWASFSKPDMVAGIGLLAISVVFTVLFARGTRGDVTAMKLSILRKGLIGGLGGMALGAILGITIPALSLSSSVTLAGGASSIVYAITEFFSARSLSSLPRPRSIWGWLSVIFTISQSIGFASNSYTIWEDEILLFFLATFGVVAAASSLRQENSQERVLGIYHSALLVLLSRFASLSRLCREEQMPYCRSTFYASSNSSTSSTWQLLIPFAVAILLPSIIKAFYQGTLSFEGSAVFWVSTVFRMGLFVIASYWTLDAINNAGWYPRYLSLVLNPTSVQIIQITLAKIVFGISIAVGAITYFWAKPCITISIEGAPESSATGPASSNPDSTTLSSADTKPTITILGYANVFGSHYLLLVTALFLPLTLLLPPMGQLSMSTLLPSILSLLEILDTNSLTPGTSTTSTLSPIGPPHPPRPPRLFPFLQDRPHSHATLHPMDLSLHPLPQHPLPLVTNARNTQHLRPPNPLHDLRPLTRPLETSRQPWPLIFPFSIIINSLVQNTSFRYHHRPLILHSLLLHHQHRHHRLRRPPPSSPDGLPRLRP